MPHAQMIDFRRAPVTLLLTAIAAAIEIVCLIDDGMRDTFYVHYRLGLLSPLWSGEVWRPATSSLLHASPLHAAFNIYWMIVFGTALEARFGPLRIGALLVLLANVSMLPEFVIMNFRVTNLSEQQGAVGLSGVVYGLFGMLWMGRRYVPEFREVCRDEIVALMVFWFFFCIAATAMRIFPVANIAHGFGLGFGALYALVIFDRQHRLAWLVAAGASTLLVLSTFAYVPRHALYREHAENEAVRRLRGTSALPTGDALLHGPHPSNAQLLRRRELIFEKRAESPGNRLDGSILPAAHADDIAAMESEQERLAASIILKTDRNIPLRQASSPIGRPVEARILDEGGTDVDQAAGGRYISASGHEKAAALVNERFVRCDFSLRRNEAHRFDMRGEGDSSSGFGAPERRRLPRRPAMVPQAQRGQQYSQQDHPEDDEFAGVIS